MARSKIKIRLQRPRAEVKTRVKRRLTGWSAHFERKSKLRRFHFKASELRRHER